MKKITSLSSLVKLFLSKPQLRGSAEHYLGNHSGTLADYNKFLESRPNRTGCNGTSKITNPTFTVMVDAGSYFDQGYQKELESKFDEAIKLFDKAIALKPDFFRAHFEKGYCKGMLRYLNVDTPAYA